MKHMALFSSLLALAAAGALAVDLNTDALKTMQKQGQEIVERAKDWQSFELDAGEGSKCLQIAGPPDKVGANVVLRKCNQNASNQQWTFDGESRLVSHGDTCIGVGGNANKPGANVVNQECGGDKSQRWQLDGQNRLHNELNKCLQATGKPGKPAGNVISQNCNGSPNQVWK